MNHEQVIVLVEVVVLATNIAMAVYQAKWFNAHMSVVAVFDHWPWALGYVVGLGAIWVFSREWFLVLECLLIRMVFFNVILNYFRHPRKPFFYIHSDDQGGSFIDKLESEIYGKYYPIAWIIEVLLLISINWFCRNPV